MNDFLGNKVVVGDTVITLAKNYRGLVKAKVLSIADKSLLVEYLNTWNYGSDGRLETYRVTGSMVVSISDIHIPPKFFDVNTIDIADASD